VPEVAAGARSRSAPRLIILAHWRRPPSALPILSAVAARRARPIVRVFVGVNGGAKAIALARADPRSLSGHPSKAHALTVRLVADVAFPYLLLLCSRRALPSAAGNFGWGEGLGLSPTRPHQLRRRREAFDQWVESKPNTPPQRNSQKSPPKKSLAGLCYPRGAAIERA